MGSHTSEPLPVPLVATRRAQSLWLTTSAIQPRHLYAESSLSTLQFDVVGCYTVGEYTNPGAFVRLVSRDQVGPFMHRTKVLFHRKRSWLSNLEYAFETLHQVES